jgi:beta-glucanase (GH16 family)
MKLHPARSRRVTVALFAQLILLAACTTTANSHPGSAQGGSGGSSATGGAGGPAKPAQTLFDDQFDGATLGNQWIAMDRHGDYGNNEAQCYVSANATLKDGNLELAAKLESRTCGDAGHAPSPWKYSSAMVQWKTLSFTYGTIEFRLKGAGGAGMWPAVWLLGTNCQQTNVQSADNSGACHWPDPGSDEIDLFEILGSDRRTLNQQLHSAGNNGGCKASVSDVSLDFHVYQVIWSPGSLIWKVDGKQTCEVKSGIPSRPMFLMINVAVGGVGGAVKDSDLPQVMQVDYLKVTQ